MKVSDAESRIMEALWAKGPMGAEEIGAEVGIEAGWSQATVRTLINRLIKKEAVAARREGRRAFYHPLISRADYVSSESETFLNRVFDGRVAPLLAHFSASGKLREEEMDTLRRMIENFDRKNREDD